LGNKSKVLMVGFCCALILLPTYFVVPLLSSPSSNSEYIILAVNESGMHCIQPDYSSFLILPPGNNLKVQVFAKGDDEAKLVRCSECHRDNSSGAAGKPGLPSLSLAIHGSHESKMGMSILENTCYNCHLGVESVLEG